MLRINEMGINVSNGKSFNTMKDEAAEMGKKEAEEYLQKNSEIIASKDVNAINALIWNMSEYQLDMLKNFSAKANQIAGRIANEFEVKTLSELWYDAHWDVYQTLCQIAISLS